MRLIPLTGICLFLTVFAGSPLALEPGGPFTKAARAYLLTVNGRTLWEHDPSLRLPPASLTKIMTALLVLKKGRLDETVRISRAAAGEYGAHLGLRAGEKMHVKDLLAAALISSDNDACHALADHFAGSEERFVKIMNEEASAMGLKDTHFTNACGHDNPKHYSTARDLAALAGEALKDPVFSRLVATDNMEISTVDRRRTFRLKNRNELLWYYPGATGVKTGHTRRAGRCLIALAERDGARVLLVMLDSKDVWVTAVGMLDSAFLQSGESKTQEAR